MEPYEECPRFDFCNAPICPANEESIKHCAWFPDEEICPLRYVPEWVKRQRRIARAAGHSFERGCFNVHMLERQCVIGKAIAGVDPDAGPPENQEAAWLENHPAYVPSAKKLEQARRNLL